MLTYSHKSVRHSAYRTSLISGFLYKGLIGDPIGCLVRVLFGVLFEVRLGSRVGAPAYIAEDILLFLSLFYFKSKIKNTN